MLVILPHQFSGDFIFYALSFHSHCPVLKNGASTEMHEGFMISTLFWNISIKEAQNFIESLKFYICRLALCYEYSKSDAYSENNFCWGDYFSYFVNLLQIKLDRIERPHYFGGGWNRA